MKYALGIALKQLFSSKLVHTVRERHGSVQNGSMVHHRWMIPHILFVAKEKRKQKVNARRKMQEIMLKHAQRTCTRQ